MKENRPSAPASTRFIGAEQDSVGRGAAPAQLDPGGGGASPGSGAPVLASMTRPLIAPA